MTNPFQHGSSSYSGDAISSAGQRRSSYASVASGAAVLSRTSRPGGPFSHLLNPSPDSETHSNLFSTHRSPRLDAGMAHGRNGSSGGDGNHGTTVPPRLGAHLPWFSRAWDTHLNKDLYFGAGLSEDGYGGLASTEGTSTFLSPSYLRGTVYLQKLEEAHKAKVVAERESHAAKPQPGGGLAAGSNTHTQGSKLPSGSHRGVAYELVEKPPAVEDENTLHPLPSRWNKDDKDPALEVLGDGYEVKFTGRGSGDHEACAIRADNFMPTLCGVYYFEVLILSRKREEYVTGRPRYWPLSFLLTWEL